MFFASCLCIPIMTTLIKMLKNVDNTEMEYWQWLYRSCCSLCCYWLLMLTLMRMQIQMLMTIISCSIAVVLAAVAFFCCLPDERWCFFNVVDKLLTMFFFFLQKRYHIYWPRSRPILLLIDFFIGRQQWQLFRVTATTRIRRKKKRNF